MEFFLSQKEREINEKDCISSHPESKKESELFKKEKRKEKGENLKKRPLPDCKCKIDRKCVLPLSECLISKTVEEYTFIIQSAVEFLLVSS